jgi:hypothetical protein
MSIHAVFGAQRLSCSTKCVLSTISCTCIFTLEYSSMHVLLTNAVCAELSRIGQRLFDPGMQLAVVRLQRPFHLL